MHILLQYKISKKSLTNYKHFFSKAMQIILVKPGISVEALGTELYVILSLNLCVL